MTIYRENAASILESQFGLGWLDSLYWGSKLASADRVVDEIFPHWVFNSILNSLEFSHIGRGFCHLKPKFVSFEPSDIELESSGFTKCEVAKFKNLTPPTLVGTAIPILGNFGSGGHGLPEYLLMRKRTGRFAQGKYSFPGGHAEGLMELTAWRELCEEVKNIGMYGLPYLDSQIEGAVRQCGLVAVADQVIIGADRRLYRFLSYMYEFRIAFPYGGGGIGYLDIKDNASKIHTGNGDGLGEWSVVMLNKNLAIEDQEIANNLAPSVRIALSTICKGPS